MDNKTLANQILEWCKDSYLTREKTLELIVNSLPKKDGAVCAWAYELANQYNRETERWDNWRAYVTFDKPRVPENSIRNLRPLYAAAIRSLASEPAPGGETRQQIEAIVGRYLWDSVKLVDEIMALLASPQPSGERADGWFLPREALNELQISSLEKFLPHANRANEIDCTIRKDARETRYEIDWIKHLRSLSTARQAER